MVLSCNLFAFFQPCNCIILRIAVISISAKRQCHLFVNLYEEEEKYVKYGLGI